MRGHARRRRSRPQPSTRATATRARRRASMRVTTTRWRRREHAGHESHAAPDHAAHAMQPQTHPATETHNPAVDMQSSMPMPRLADPGVGLRDNGRRVLAYADLRSAFADPDGRAPGRTIELHLTGHMDRFLWSFDGVPFSGAEPLVLNYGERVRFVLVNDTMMEHPIHLARDVERPRGRAGSSFSSASTRSAFRPARERSFRVTADALGRWAFHCHLLYHMTAGMFREVRESRRARRRRPSTRISTCTTTRALRPRRASLRTIIRSMCTNKRGSRFVRAVLVAVVLAGVATPRRGAARAAADHRRRSCRGVPRPRRALARDARGSVRSFVADRRARVATGRRRRCSRVEGACVGRAFVRQARDPDRGRAARRRHGARRAAGALVAHDHAVVEPRDRRAHGLSADAVAHMGRVRRRGHRAVPLRHRGDRVSSPMAATARRASRRRTSS